MTLSLLASVAQAQLPLLFDREDSSSESETESSSSESETESSSLEEDDAPRPMLVPGFKNYTQPVVIRDDDVLGGRSAGVRDHPGNRYFLSVLQIHKKEYDAIARGKKHEVVKRVVSEIENIGGRFLTQDRINGPWFLMDQRKMYLKTSQAFRDTKSMPKKNGRPRKSHLDKVQKARKTKVVSKASSKTKTAQKPKKKATRKALAVIPTPRTYVKRPAGSRYRSAAMTSTDPTPKKTKKTTKKDLVTPRSNIRETGSEDFENGIARPTLFFKGDLLASNDAFCGSPMPNKVSPSNSTHNDNKRVTDSGSDTDDSASSNSTSELSRS